MIKFDNSFHLARIQEEYAYCDEKSLEKLTNIIKRKYKVCGKKLINVYPFFISTSKPDSCAINYTVCINKDDWEHKNHNYLYGCSYFSPNHIEAIEEKDVLTKINDPENGLKTVGKMPSLIYAELIEKCVNYKRRAKPPEKPLLELVLSDEQQENILRNLGIL